METRNYAYGTSLTVQLSWSTYVAGRAMCGDGKVRSLQRIAQTADTFFSVPAAVKVNGRTVSGYITSETADGWSTETEDDPTVIKFVAYSQRRNGHLLPGLAWRRPADHPFSPHPTMPEIDLCQSCTRSAAVHSLKVSA